MACITKKSVKWNGEPVSMISTADYSKLQSPVMVAKRSVLTAISLNRFTIIKQAQVLGYTFRVILDE